MIDPSYFQALQQRTLPRTRPIRDALHLLVLIGRARGRFVLFRSEGQPYGALIIIKATDGVEFVHVRSRESSWHNVFNNERVDHAPSGRELGPRLYGLGAWSAIEGRCVRKLEVLELQFYQI